MENKKQTAITLPRCIEDVDADWLTEALGSIGNNRNISIWSTR